MSVFTETLKSSAHYELRQQHSRWLAAGLFLAAVLHGIPAIFGPAWVEAPFQLPPQKIKVFEVPIWVPTKPVAIPRPDIDDGVFEPVDEIFADPLAPTTRETSPLRPPAPIGSAEAGTGPGAAGFSGPEARSPEILHRVVAGYPEMARMAEAEGTVVLLVTVGIDGLVTSAVVAESDTITSLENAALAAIRRWIFRPAYQGSRPVAVQIRVPFEFRLR